jgi:hypothetical protein
MSDDAMNLRKAMLLNRSALLAAWPRHFPEHEFLTLRPLQSWPSPEEAWAESARAYHRDRKRNAVLEPV